jgi:hypothetical protein
MQRAQLPLDLAMGAVKKIEDGKSNAIGRHGGFLSKVKPIIKMLRRSNLIWRKQADMRSK